MTYHWPSIGITTLSGGLVACVSVTVRWTVWLGVLATACNWAVTAPGCPDPTVKQVMVRRDSRSGYLRSVGASDARGMASTLRGSCRTRTWASVLRYSECFLERHASSAQQSGDVVIVCGPFIFAGRGLGLCVVCRSLRVLSWCDFGQAGSGNQDQHGAVVAREYGKPCVSGVERAASRLRNGQLVEVNGTDGVVRILS